MRVCDYKIKNCRRCDIEFKPASGKQYFCSDRCRFGVGICKECGNEFDRKSNTKGDYCSTICWYKAPGKKVLEPKHCKFCDKIFQPPDREREYCSTECAYESMRSPNRVENCAYCGNAMRKNCDPHNIYCSRRCAATDKWEKGHGHDFQNRNIGDIIPGPSGYLLIKVGPSYHNVHKSGFILHHRYVMQEFIGRPLEPHERVHHKNGNRSDNRPENLELWKVKKKDPCGIRATDYHCAGCKCFETHVYDNGGGI